MRMFFVAAAAALAVISSTAAQAQMGVKLSADNIPPRSIPGNPTAANAAPVPIKLPPQDCKADEALTFKGGEFSCVALPTGGGGSQPFTVTNGLRFENNVLSLYDLVEDRADRDAPITAADGAKMILVGGHTYPIAQAGTAGIIPGWGVFIKNQTTDATARIATNVSLFLGAPGSPTSEIMLAPKQSLYLTPFQGDYSATVNR